ncbi:MAG: Secretion system C-terminal sorting domain [Flavipsychrobacter sp.]|nr:Secretion system C-terminal sorting domain [Flavipsychrobacter sp.]
MKKLILYLAMIFLSASGYAQQFAPIGSEWYNDVFSGIFHLQTTKDTVIDNVSARQITYTPHSAEPWLSMGFKLWGEPPAYVYNNDDTVFLYNMLFEKFTPLYVFNVNDGDTVTLPLTPPLGCDFFMGSLGDSLFSYVVDSVRVVLYDTAYLQTFYTHPISTPGRQKMSFPVYARVLGGLSTGLLPNCDSCAASLAANCVGPSNIRCYHSSNYDIKLVSGDCAKGIKVSVGDIYKEGIAIGLYPNPATDQITVRFSKPFTRRIHCSLTDIVGREVLAADINASTTTVSYDVAQLPPGQYNFILRDGANILFKRKLVVAQ